MGALKLKGRWFGQGIRLDATAAVPEVAAPVWVQVARQGVFKGHKNGTLTFNKALFDQVIANFHAHPAFEAGPDGVGKARVIPFDYEHASELNPTSGSIPLTGAPAPAWTLDLKTQQGTEGLEMWALAEILPVAREQIRAGGYQWTSVAIWMNSVDPVSGENVGPVLTSIAFTNKPFVEGMEPMRATISIYGEAETPEEMVVGLREILQLDEGDDLTGAIVELGQAYDQDRRLPGYPEGVGCLLDQIRRLLGLRVLATADDIVAMAGQAVAALPPSTSKPLPEPVLPAPGDPMAESLASKLAELFNCRDKEDVILLAAGKANGALSVLNDLMAKYGAADPKDLMEKATAAQADATKAAGFATKLNEALAALVDGGAEQAEAKASDVQQVAASFGIVHLGAAVMLLAAAHSSVENEVELIAASQGIGDKPHLKKMLLSARVEAGKSANGLAEFRKLYPVPDAQQHLLTRPIIATTISQLGGPHTGLVSGAAPGSAAGAVPEHIKAIEGYPGSNNVQKAIAMLCDKQPGFSKQNWSQQNFLAGRYVDTGKAA